jgi:hypothetical protein
MVPENLEGDLDALSPVFAAPRKKEGGKQAKKRHLSLFRFGYNRNRRSVDQGG